MVTDLRNVHVPLHIQYKFEPNILMLTSTLTSIPLGESHKKHVCSQI